MHIVDEFDLYLFTDFCALMDVDALSLVRDCGLASPVVQGACLADIVAFVGRHAFVRCAVVLLLFCSPGKPPSAADT